MNIFKSLTGWTSQTGRLMPIERQKIKRGDVYTGDLEPVVGYEQGGRPPFLVVSIEPPEGGLERVSFAMPGMVCSISSLRLQRRLGRASMDTVESVANRIGLLVGLGRSR